MSVKPRHRLLHRSHDPLHPQPRRPVQSGDRAARQPVRHDRHDDRRAGDGVRAARHARRGYAWIVGAMVVGGSDRPLRGAHRQDDADAGAGRADAQPGRPRRLLVGFASYIDPAASVGSTGAEKTIHEIEIYIGILIGAVTFSGSVIAFGKLSAQDQRQAAAAAGAPLAQPRRACCVVIWFGYGFLSAAHRSPTGMTPLIVMTVDRAAVRHPHGDGDRRRRHAGGGVDAQQLLGLGGGGDRLHAVERPADRHRRAGRLLAARSSPTSCAAR